MSNSLDGFAKPLNPMKDAEKWYDKLAAKYPLLALALLGNEMEKGSSGCRPPFSIIIAVKGDSLRGSLSNPEAYRTCFLPIDDPAEPLEALERALATGKGEWVDKPKDWASKRR